MVNMESKNKTKQTKVTEEEKNSLMEIFGILVQLFWGNIQFDTGSMLYVKISSKGLKIKH